METHEQKSGAAQELPKDDPKAREILRRAFEKTERWAPGFSGFAADLTANIDGKEISGKLSAPNKEVSVSLPDEGLSKWVTGQVSMMMVHRMHRTFEESDGKYALTLGEEEPHPYGRLIYIHGDGMNSRYRVLDDRILQIHREMGKMKFTINVEEALKTPSGRYITTHFAVFYFAPDGPLTGTEVFRDQHAVVNGVYLPGIRRVTNADKGGVSVRMMAFSNHRLL